MKLIDTSDGRCPFCRWPLKHTPEEVAQRHYECSNPPCKYEELQFDPGYAEKWLREHPMSREEGRATIK